METRALDARTIVRIVRQVCDQQSHTGADDLASNLIASIWAKQIEFRDEGHLRNYARKSLRHHLANSVRANRRIRLFSESMGEEMSESEWLDRLAETPAQQEAVYAAKQIKAIAANWPFVHRSLVYIIADGASLLDAAQELGLRPWDAIRLLQEARRFMEDGAADYGRDMAA